MELLHINWISLVGALLGIIFLYLEYKANAWMWLVSIFMAVFYIYIFYATQLYASMLIYVYFLGASIYGSVVWLKDDGIASDGEIQPIRTPRKMAIRIVLICLLACLLIYLFLDYFTVNPLAIKLGDSLTTALNVVALWMISKKWAEQWLLVIPANLVSAILLFVQQDMLSASLFYIYFMVSIAGYYKWKRMADKNIN